MSEYIKRDKANRYIDQDKVIDAVLNLDTSNRISWQDAVIDMIDAMPPKDVQPVVRCKDCVYWSSKETKYCNMLQGTFQENDYCSYGEDPRHE